MATEVLNAQKAGQIISHQPLTRFACRQAVIIHYSLLANAIYTRQISGATAIKSMCHVDTHEATPSARGCSLRDMRDNQLTSIRIESCFLLFWRCISCSFRNKSISRCANYQVLVPRFVAQKLTTPYLSRAKHLTS